MNLTEQEIKAYEMEAVERIVDLFFHEVLHYDVEYGHKLAKACAVIHCKGIIEVLTKINDDYDDNFLDNRIDHWNKLLNYLQNDNV